MTRLQRSILEGLADHHAAECFPSQHTVADAIRAALRRIDELERANNISSAGPRPRRADVS
jgi:hypothetical protein